MVDKRLLQEARREKKLIALTIFLGMVVGILVVFQASYVSRIVQGVFLEGENLADVWPLLLYLLIFITVKSLLIWLEEITASYTAARIKDSLRQRLLERLFELGPTYIWSKQTGSLVGLLTDGIGTLETYFARYLPQLAKTVLIPLLILIFIFPRDYLSGFILLGTAPLIPVFMILIGKWAERITQKQWGILTRMNGHFQDVLRGLATLKAFGRSKNQGKVIARVSNQFRQTTLGVLRVAFLSALTLELVATLSTAVLAVSIGLRLVYGGISFAEGFFILLLAPEFYLPFRLLGSQYHEGLAAVNAAEEIFVILDQPLSPQKKRGENSFPSRSPVEISFEDVEYAYEGGTRQALKGLSFDLRAGERLAIVGESGGGKSTIAALLLGFIQPLKGQIKINGVPLGDYSLLEWRQKVAYVPQQPYLLQGTIGENISLGRPEASPEEIERAAKLAGAHEFILQLPQGYETPVGEGGGTLSGGQVQRVAIARAFLQDAPLLILDEATTGLDPHREKEITKALEKLMEGRSVIIIAHNLYTVFSAHRILVVQKGKIIEDGRHGELLKRQGVYYQMVMAQEKFI